MNDSLVKQFTQLISSHIGLNIREQDQEALRQKIQARMKCLKLSHPEAYYQLLQVEANQDAAHAVNKPPLHKSEWNELALLLTTGESYFFRDQGQLQLLQNQLLPELIESRLKSSADDRKPCLKLWSAGCSTGEEAYSLAILLSQLIPDLSRWDISILGTDINAQAIHKAQKGIYNSWSFRTLNPSIQSQYFYRYHSDWRLQESIRQMVKFQTGNLLKDPFPNSSSEIYEMDIILCRNVFIYFGSHAIATVLKKFNQSLRPGGYLLSGHAELYGQPLGDFKTKIFPESIVYQRPVPEVLPPPQPAPSAPIAHNHGNNPSEKLTHLKVQRSLSPTSDPSKAIAPACARPSTPSADLSIVETYFQQGNYAGVIQAAKQIIHQYPNHFEAYYLIAQAYANLGSPKQASDFCYQALAVNPVAVSPYYLLAHIAEEQGDHDTAKHLLKKVVYLVPSAITAYLELGALYAKEGDQKRAYKMRTTALELLQELPPNSRIEPYKNITANELLTHIKQTLETDFR